MAGIGEYIHYDYRNYLVYGLSKPSADIMGISNSTVANYQRQRNALLAKVKARSNKEVWKQELENRINFFLNVKSNSANLTYDQVEIDKWEEALKKKIADDLGVKASSIDWEHLTASSTSGRGFGLDKGGKRWALEEKGLNEIAAVDSRLTDLYHAINKMLNLKMDHAKELKAQLDSLQSKWDIIKESFSAENTKIKFNNRVYFESEAGSNFIKELNSLWQEFKKNIDSNITGRLGEDYVALALESVKALGQKGAQDILNTLETGIKHVTGDVRISHGISSSNVAVQSFTKAGDMRGSKIFGINHAALSTIQDKTDVAATINLPELGIQTFNISVKNYSDTSKIHIHTGRSILALVQQYTDFMNHYLNITASGTPALVNGNLVYQMNETLKMTLLVHGLIGEYTTASGLSKQADTFVYKDNDRFKVVFMDDIIKQVLNNPSLGTIKDFNLNMHWPVHWVGDLSAPNYHSAYSRINNILSALNSFALDMTINMRDMLI